MRFRPGRMTEREYISGDRKHGMIPRQFDSWRHVLAVAEQLDHVVSGHVLVTWSLPIAVVIGDYVVQLLLVVRVNVLHEGSKNPAHPNVRYPLVQILLGKIKQALVLRAAEQERGRGEQGVRVCVHQAADVGREEASAVDGRTEGGEIFGGFDVHSYDIFQGRLLETL